MSPKSTEMDSKDPRPYEAFFSELTVAKCKVFSYPDHDGGWMFALTITTEQGDVTLYFETSDYGEFWLVTGLSTPLNDPAFLTGEALLAFFGKRYAKHGGGLESDFTQKKPVHNWQIDCPASVLALLKAYNELAHLQGKIELWH